MRKHQTNKVVLTDPVGPASQRTETPALLPTEIERLGLAPFGVKYVNISIAAAREEQRHEDWIEKTLQEICRHYEATGEMKVVPLIDGVEFLARELIWGHGGVPTSRLKGFAAQIAKWVGHVVGEDS